LLRRIFGHKREEVAGGWRRLHKEMLHNLYASPNSVRVVKSRRTIWARHVARMRKMRNAYNIFVGKRRGNRPFERPKRRYEDNIRMDVREMGREFVDWMHLLRDREQWWAFVNTVMNLRLP